MISCTLASYFYFPPQKCLLWVRFCCQFDDLRRLLKCDNWNGLEKLFSWKNWFFDNKIFIVQKTKTCKSSFIHDGHYQSCIRRSRVGLIRKSHLDWNACFHFLLQYWKMYRILRSNREYDYSKFRLSHYTSSFPSH